MIEDWNFAELSAWANASIAPCAKSAKPCVTIGILSRSAGKIVSARFWNTGVKALSDA